MKLAVRYSKGKRRRFYWDELTYETDKSKSSSIKGMCQILELMCNHHHHNYRFNRYAEILRNLLTRMLMGTMAGKWQFSSESELQIEAEHRTIFERRMFLDKTKRIPI
jgi:hypothetical protein